MKKVVLFGDSIFNGYRNGHDTNLVSRLFQKAWPQAQIENISLSGATTNQALNLLNQLDPHADLVIVEYGTNDSAMSWGLDLPLYQKNLEKITQQIGPARTVIVGPCFPNPNNPEIMQYYTPARLKQYNDAAAKVAQEWQVKFVDLIAAMQPLTNIDQYYQADGQHLSDLGNQVLVKTITAVINS